MSRNFPAATKSCCQSWGIKKNNMVRYVYFVGSYLNHYSICWNLFVKEVNETIPRLILPSFSSFFKWWTRFTLAAWCRCLGVSWEKSNTSFSVIFLWSSLKTDQSVWDQAKVKVNCIAHAKPPELRKVLHRQPLIKQKHFKKRFYSAFNSELLLISLFLSLFLVILLIIWLAETNALQWVWTSTRSDKYSSASPFRM